MVQDGKISIRYKDVHHDEKVNDAVESHCRMLSREFPETTHFEVALGLEAGKVSAHAHVSGKNTQLSSQASAADPRKAAGVALDKLERELRRHHDKQIFTARREAQKGREKR